MVGGDVKFMMEGLPLQDVYSIITALSCSTVMLYKRIKSSPPYCGAVSLRNTQHICRWIHIPRRIIWPTDSPMNHSTTWVCCRTKHGGMCARMTLTECKPKWFLHGTSQKLVKGGHYWLAEWQSDRVCVIFLNHDSHLSAVSTSCRQDLTWLESLSVRHFFYSSLQ